MSGCGTRIVLRGQKPLALCDRCPCFGSLFPPLAALTFAASSIICAFGLAAAAPRSPYRHLELCGIALDKIKAYAPCQPGKSGQSGEHVLFLFYMGILYGSFSDGINIRQHRTIPALRQAPLRQLRHGICVAKMLDNVGLRYPHRASGQSPSHSATAAPASVRCFRHWRRSPLQHPVLSALLAWHLPRLARRIGT